MGNVIIMSALSGTAAICVKLNAACTAIIFGTISPNVSIITVIMAVATHVPLSPIISMAITVATDEEAMFTRLLPISMVISASS